MSRFKHIHFIVLIFSSLVAIVSSGYGHGNRQRPGGSGWNRGGNRGQGQGQGWGWGHNSGQGQRPNYNNYPQPQPQPQNTDTCTSPEFTDHATFEVENCQRNNWNHGCHWGRIPSQWTGTMVCTKGFATLKYTSTCQSDGTWNPGFPDNCAHLVQLQGFVPTDNSGNGNGNDNSQVNPIPPPTHSSKSDCMQFQVRLSENFILTCLFPGSSAEVENCFTNRRSVPSGTKLFLKCKSPYRSATGTYPEWICDDGRWPSETNKLMCTYSSYNEHTVDATTQSPWNQHQNPHPSPKVTTTPSPPIVVPAKTTTVTPGWYKPPPVIPPIVVPRKETHCPALTHKPPGVRVECVTSGQGVQTTNCESPMAPGSEAKYFCEDYYESTFGLKTLFRKCKEDGSWTGGAENFKCIPQCGRANVVRVPYITNGLPTVRAQWPWHAALFLHAEKTNTWSFICGGTLISKRAILTAAHCVTLFQTTEARSKTQFRIDLGKYEREETDDLVQMKRIQELQVHPSYNPYGYDSDIALVILDSEIEIGYHVRPICFPQTSDTALEELQLAENSIGTVVGWGYDENKQLATALRMARLKVIGRRECSQTASGGSSGQIHTRSTTYCAGFQNGTNVCNGDSGGGMYFNSKEADEITRWYLQGIVSVGIADESGRCDPKQYSVFTRVGRYADWITRILTENEAL